MIAHFVDWLIDPWNLMVLGGIVWITGKLSKRPTLCSWGIRSALFVLVLLGYSPVPTWLIGNLENQYEPLNAIDLAGDMKYDVLVLGGGHVDDPDVPRLAQLELSSLARLTEGVRVSRQVAVRNFTLSGYASQGEESHAQVMKEAAISLGVDRNSIHTMDETLNTMDEARTYSQHDPTDPFILVTSASHMPRSMKTFRAMGLNPIAAPTDFKIREDPDENGLMFSPGSKFRWFRLAMHEYIGMIYYKRKFSQ